MEVIARCRPPLKAELASGNSLLSVKLDSATQNITLTPSSALSNATNSGNVDNNHNDSQLSLLSTKTLNGPNPPSSSSSRSFKVDKLLDHRDTSNEAIEGNQDALYDQLEGRHIRRAIIGQDTSIIVHGSKKSGKSYTTHGATDISEVEGQPFQKNFSTFFLSNGELDKRRAGLIPRVVNDLFSESRQKNLKHPVVFLSMSCVYDEKISDLLNPAVTRASASVSGGESLQLFYSDSLKKTFVGSQTRHACKSYKNCMELYEQGLAIFTWQMSEEKKTFQRGGSLIVDLTLAYERDVESGKVGVVCPFVECGLIRVVEVGSFEKTPPETDFGDRLNRKSLVGHGLENLRKVLSSLAESTSNALSGSGVISRPKYKKACLTYLLRNELAGEPNPEQLDEEEERKRKKEAHKLKQKRGSAIVKASGVGDEEIMIPQNDCLTFFVCCIGATSQHFNSMVNSLKSMDKARNFNSSNVELKAVLEKRLLKQKGKRRSSMTSPVTVVDSSAGEMEGNDGDKKTGKKGIEYDRSRNLITQLSLEIEKVEEKEYTRIVEEEQAAAEANKKGEGGEGEGEKEKGKEGKGGKKMNRKEQEMLARKEKSKAAKVTKLKAEQEEEGLYHENFRVEVVKKIEGLKKLRDFYTSSLKKVMNGTKLNAEERVGFMKRRFVYLVKENKIKGVCLVALNEDSFMHCRLKHHLENGQTYSVGRRDATTIIHLKLGGGGVLPFHATFHNDGDVIFLKSEGKVYVNGVQEYDKQLNHGDVIKIGCHLFCVWDYKKGGGGDDGDDDDDDSLTTTVSAVTKGGVNGYPVFENLAMGEVEKFVTKLVRKEQRHWKVADDTVRVLKAEIDRVTAMVNSLNSKKESGTVAVPVVAGGEEKKGDFGGGEDGDEGDDNLSDYSDTSFDPTNPENLAELLRQYEEAIMSIEESKARHVTCLTHEIFSLYPILEEINEIADELEKFMEYELCLVSKGGDTPPALAESVGDYGGGEGGGGGGEGGGGGGGGGGGERKERRRRKWRRRKWTTLIC